MENFLQETSLDQPNLGQTQSGIRDIPIPLGGVEENTKSPPLAFPDPRDPEQREELEKFYTQNLTSEQAEQEAIDIMNAQTAIFSYAGIDYSRPKLTDYSKQELEYIDADRDKIMVPFPDTANDVGSRRAFMARMDATGLLVGDNTKRSQQRFVPLGVEPEYEEMTDVESLSPVGATFQKIRDIAVGTGPFAMKDLDRQLKAKGLSQTARTRLLRLAASGELTDDKITGALTEMIQFFGEVPTTYAPQVSKFILTDLIAPAAEWAMAEDFTKGKTETKQFIDNWTKEDWQSQAEKVSEKNSTEDYVLSTDVARTMMTPDSLTERALVLAAAEVPFAGAQAVWHGGKALLANRRFTSYMKTTFNSDDLESAFNAAFENGLDMEGIMTNYLNGVRKNGARRRQAELLDTAFAFKTVLPGNQRQEIFKDEVASIRVKISNSEAELKNAEKVGDLKGIEKAELRIKKLNDDAQTLRSKIILPKYFRDLYTEVKQQVIAATYMSETAQQIFSETGKFGVEPAVMGEFAGAISTAIPYLRGGVMLPHESVKGLTRFLANAIPGVSIKSQVLDASPATKELLGIVFKNPESHLAQSLIAGAEGAVRLRTELAKLAKETGVDIDYDYFSKTIVELSAIDELKAIQDQANSGLVLKGIGDLNSPAFNDFLENNNKLKEMSTRLTEMTYVLMEKRADGSMRESGVELLEEYVGGINSYIVDLNKRIEADASYINDVISLQDNMKGLLIKGGLQRADAAVRSGGDESLEALENVYETEEKLLLEKYEGDLTMGDIDPEVLSEKLRTDIDALIDTRTELLRMSASEISASQAALGQSAHEWAVAMVHTKRKQVVKARRMYTQLDEKYAGARSNVASFYEKFKDIGEFVDGDVDDYSKGAIRLRKMSVKSETRVGAKILFNDGARRGLDDLREGVGDSVYNSLLEHADLEDELPIVQWEQLKAFLKDPGDKADEVAEYLDLDQAAEMSDSLLMLISPGEWRALESHMGSQLYELRGNPAAITYGAVKKEWDDIVNLESPMAFKTGYDTGIPKNVTVQFKDDLDVTNRNYEVNVADRLNIDDDLKRWNKSITRRVMSKKDGDMPTLSRKAKAGDQSLQWLGKILSPVQKLKPGGALVGDQLYQTIGQRLAKAGDGVWDEKLGKYVFVLGEGSTKAVRALLTAHMRGRLILTDAGRQLVDTWDPTVARKRDEVDPLMLEDALKFNEAEFDSMFNLPVYKRDEAGELVEAGPLLNREEVFEAISIDALERNRSDLKGVFDEAEIINSRSKDEALKLLSKNGHSAELDINFALRLSESFGIKVGKGGVLTPANLDTIASSVFETVVNRTPLKFAEDIATLKNSLKQVASSSGIDPEDVDLVVDDFIKRMTVQHIYGSTAASAGNVLMKGTQQKTGPTIRAAMGIDGDAIRNLVGVADQSGATTDALISVLGAETYENILTVADTAVRLQARGVKGATAKRTGMSLESILSRIYNINRQVVSTQWVATETLIRASQNNKGALFQALISDSQVAKELFEIIETGQIPEYKQLARWQRALTREVARFEAINGRLQQENPLFDEKPKAPIVSAYDRQMRNLGYVPK